MWTERNRPGMGCTDTAPAANPERLSRIKDLLDAGRALGLDTTVLFGMVTQADRLDFNYAIWEYVPPK